MNTRLRMLLVAGLVAGGTLATQPKAHATQTKEWWCRVMPEAKCWTDCLGHPGDQCYGVNMEGYWQDVP